MDSILQASEEELEAGPQGSYLLAGSWNRDDVLYRPIHPGDEYDMDLVCRRELAKTSISQAALKMEVGRDLASYVASRPDGSPTLDEGKRALQRFDPDICLTDLKLPDGNGIDFIRSALPEALLSTQIWPCII